MQSALLTKNFPVTEEVDNINVELTASVKNWPNAQMIAA
jgi:hypothetical protein